MWTYLELVSLEKWHSGQKALCFSCFSLRKVYQYILRLVTYIVLFRCSSYVETCRERRCMKLSFQSCFHLHLEHETPRVFSLQLQLELTASEPLFFLSEAACLSHVKSIYQCRPSVTETSHVSFFLICHLWDTSLVTQDRILMQKLGQDPSCPRLAEILVFLLWSYLPWKLTSMYFLCRTALHCFSPEPPAVAFPLQQWMNEWGSWRVYFLTQSSSRPERSLHLVSSSNQNYSSKALAHF